MTEAINKETTETCSSHREERLDVSFKSPLEEFEETLPEPSARAPPTTLPRVDDGQTVTGNELPNVRS